MNPYDRILFVYGEESIDGHCLVMDLIFHLRSDLSCDAISSCDHRHQGAGVIDSDQFVIDAGMPYKP